MRYVDNVEELWIPANGLKLHVRQREGRADLPPFVLLHGLASNSLTWEPLSRLLNQAGHTVVSVDQRGHGLSDKPESGYTFADFTSDLRDLTSSFGWGRPFVLAGQSWGGAVAVEYVVHNPQDVCGLVLVDGGYGELSARPGATWERVAVELRPPDLAGRLRTELAERMRRMHPDWTEEGIENMLGNFETLPDGTVRPWLSLDHHMAILRSLWEYHPSQLYARVRAPVLILPAVGPDGARVDQKRAAIRVAEARLACWRVHWFNDSDHDIHVQRPAELSDVILRALDDGFLCPR